MAPSNSIPETRFWTSSVSSAESISLAEIFSRSIMGRVSIPTCSTLFSPSPSNPTTGNPGSARHRPDPTPRGALLQVDQGPRLYPHVLDALQSVPVELDDREPRLRLDLPEPEPLRRPRVVRVLFVLVEIVVMAKGDVIEGGRDHVGLQVRLAHLVLARLQPRHQPVRHEDIDVRVPRRHHRPRPEHGPMRHQGNPNVHPIELIRPVVQIEPVRRMDVHQVRVLQSRRRRPQPRRLVVASRDDVGNTGPRRDAGRLLEEPYDDVRGWPDRVED